MKKLRECFINELIFNHTVHIIQRSEGSGQLLFFVTCVVP